MADAGLILNMENLRVHTSFVKQGGVLFVNTTEPGDYRNIDATGIARNLGSVNAANLVLLGFAVGIGNLFCDAVTARAVIEKMLKGPQAAINLKAFDAGVKGQG
jgi:Pyruvate/2-oxoacid:ferredoxin oxidoreductase gamma subunit